jgi:hypothetical protein
MSIFKSTLKPEIAAQLKAREKIVSSPNRSGDFLRYTSGKNSWVRMASFVNYDSKKFDPSTGTLVDDGKYKGDQLSKKYILEGGTLYNTKDKNFSLRSGVGKVDGVYASNIDKISSNPADTKVDRMYGLRPMPGITSVNVMNKGAYGSLREATVNFYAWDKHQLEELELLFMRTGYTVFLEWGWSQYIDHDAQGSKGINSEPDNISVKSFDFKTFDVFTSNPNENAIYDEIDKTVEKSKGNYDAMLGFVKNFSWQLMPNGGFQCSTTLISRGEAIETIKASANPYTILGSAPDPLLVNNVEQPQPVYSVFEKIFLNIIGHVNEAEFVSTFGTDGIYRPGSMNVSGSTFAQIKRLQDQAEEVYNNIKGTLSSGSYGGINTDGDIETLTIGNLDEWLYVKFSDGNEEGTGIEYIELDAFVAILNEFFIFKDHKSPPNSNGVYPPVITILMPRYTPCLASNDSVSIDPTVCLIQNSLATLITGNSTGFTPDLYQRADFVDITTNPKTTSSSTTLSEFIISPNGKTDIGAIGNIGVSINHIIKRYRELSGGPSGVDIITLLQTILDDISFSLGGINDFKLYNHRNTVQIIDVKYLGDGTKDSKFKFDLIGLKSICRDVKINSRVFAEQATMMAIGATSANRANNLGDIYTSTQNYFNQGLVDRVLSTSYSSTDDATIQAKDANGNDVTGLQAYYISLYNQIQSLTSYLRRNVLGTGGDWNVTKVPNPSDIINAGSLLKTLHYQIDGKDVDYKALIPFELEITLDGIGGFIIGQIFTIDKSILPRDYYNKNLGFIITGVSHALQNNDWTTTLKTQICLLENDLIVNKYKVDRDKLVGIIAQFKTQAYAKGLLLAALSDYMVHEFMTFFLLERSGDRGGDDNVPPMMDVGGGATLKTQLSYAPFFASRSFTGAGTHNDWTSMVGTSTTAPPQNLKQFINSGNQPVLSVVVQNPYNFVRRAFTTSFHTSHLMDYLQTWYNIAKNQPQAQSNPDFPIDFNTFITGGGGTKLDVDSFKNLLLGGVDNKTKVDATFGASSNSPANISEAWSKFWINQINNGVPFNIPISQGSESSIVTLLDPGAQKNTQTSTYQQVPNASDNSYFLTPHSFPANQLYEMYIRPYEIMSTRYDYSTGGGVTTVYYDYFYLSPGALGEVFGLCFQFLKLHQNEIGIDQNLSVPGTFQPTTWNFEKILKIE